MPLLDGLGEDGMPTLGLLHSNAGQVLHDILQYWTLLDLINVRLTYKECLKLVELASLESQWRSNPRSLTVGSRSDIRCFRKIFPSAKALCVTVAEHFTDDTFREIGSLRFADLRSHQSVVDVSVSDAGILHISNGLQHLRAEHMFNITGSCWASCSHLHTLKLKSMSGLTPCSFSSLPSLRCLELINCPRLDGSILAHAPPLEHLLWHHHSGSRPLTGAQLARVGRTLTTLRLHAVQCEDLHLYGRYFPTLQRVEVTRCTGLQGLVLQGLPELKELRLAGCRDIVSDTPWDLPRLEKLTLIQCPSLAPFVLASLPALAELHLMPNEDDWDPLHATIWTSEHLEQVVAHVHTSLRSLETNLPVTASILRLLSSLCELECDGPVDLSDEALRTLLPALVRLECSGDQTTGVEPISAMLTPAGIVSFLARRGGARRVLLSQCPRAALEAMQLYLHREAGRHGISVVGEASRQLEGDAGVCFPLPRYTVRVSYPCTTFGTLEVDRVPGDCE